MKRALIVVLCFVLFHTILTADALALTRGNLEPRSAVKVASAVARLGTGQDALVALRLQDKTVVKGYVTAVGSDSFVVTNNDSGVEQRVPYAQVKRLEGVNLDSDAQVHVGGGFKARVVRAAALLLPMHRVQRNSLTGGEKMLLIGIVVGVLVAIIVAKTV